MATKDDILDAINKLAGEVQKVNARVEAVERDSQQSKLNLDNMLKNVPNLRAQGRSMQERNRAAKANPPDIQLEKEPGFAGKEDACPYCKSLRRASLLDLTESGTYQCRKCGKHWYEKQLSEPYSKATENGFPVSSDDKYIIEPKGEKDAKRQTEKVST